MPSPTSLVLSNIVANWDEKKSPWTYCSNRTVIFPVKIPSSVPPPLMQTSHLAEEVWPVVPLLIPTSSTPPKQAPVWLELTVRCQGTYHSKSQSAQTQGSETTVPEASRPRAHWAPGLRFLNIFLSPMTQGSPLERKFTMRKAEKQRFWNKPVSQQEALAYSFSFGHSM